MWYRQDDEFFGMRQEGETWSAGRRDSEITRADQHYYAVTPKRDIRERQSEIQKWLANRHSGAHPQNTPATEHAELLIWSETPNEFNPSSPPFDTYEGYVFYVIPVSKLPSS